ncbi:uncharacterized protein LOC141700436 [Apium graveolens]|uniref:uncharacterized protein LOC141700436 n=1 Tax=Apium graveolens TaxID=4045 RepID=UPI003D7B1252
MELRRLILSIPITYVDKVSWEGLDNPTVSSIWNSIRSTAAPPPWLPAVWHRVSIPKCSFTMWLAMQNRLLTKDIMIHFGFNVSPTCVLCYSNVESNRHMDCPYSYLILKGCPFNINIDWDAWQVGNFIDGRVSVFTKHLVWLYIDVAVYSIWRERNQRIHHSGSGNVDTTVGLVKRMVREKLATTVGFQKQIRNDPSLARYFY